MLFWTTGTKVRVKTRFTGICGKNWHGYNLGLIPIPTEPHTVTARMATLTLVPTFSRTVMEVGDLIADLNYKVG